MAKEPELVTRTQLARIWGVSPSAIDHLVQTGKLTKAGYGTFNLKQANKERAAVRPTADRTDRIVRAAREAEEIAAKAATEAKAIKKAAKAVVPPANLQSDAADDGPGLKVIEGGKASDGKVAEAANTLLRARTTREVFTARTAEMNFKKEAGLLIETAKVKQSAANAARLITARLRSFPSRLGPQLAPITNSAECVKTIEVEVRALIEEFHQMMASI